MRVIIVGGGEVAFFLARTFISKGYQVSIINRIHQECEKLAKSLNALIIKGDATDPRILEDAGAREAQILIAVTPKDHVNLVCCQTSTLLFNIPRTLAMVNDPDNYEIFKRLGIDHVFNQTDLIVSMLEKNVGYEFVNHLFTFGGGKVLLNEIDVRESMPSVGKGINELDLPENAHVIGIIRNNEFMNLDGEYRFQPDDKVLIITDPEVHGPTLRMLCGEEA